MQCKWSWIHSKLDQGRVHELEEERVSIFDLCCFLSMHWRLRRHLIGDKLTDGRQYYPVCQLDWGCPDCKGEYHNLLVLRRRNPILNITDSNFYLKYDVASLTHIHSHESQSNNNKTSHYPATSNNCVNTTMATYSLQLTLSSLKVCR